MMDTDGRASATSKRIDEIESYKNPKKEIEC